MSARTEFASADLFTELAAIHAELKRLDGVIKAFASDVDAAERADLILAVKVHEHGVELKRLSGLYDVQVTRNLDQTEVNGDVRRRLTKLEQAIESWQETFAILSDPDLMAAIRQSEQDIAEGRTVSWEELKAELEKGQDDE